MSVWSGAFAGAVPLTQINALPLQSVQQFVAGDGADTIVANGRVCKYWSPAVLGIDNDAPGLSGTKYHLTTPWIDVTPCLFFVINIMRTIPAGDPALAARPIYPTIQYKLTPADTPPLTLVIGGGINDEYNGAYYWETTAIQFPGLAGASVERWTSLLSPNTGAGGGATVANMALIMGPSVRFQLNFNAAAPPAGDHSTYSLAIWGSST